MKTFFLLWQILTGMLGVAALLILLAIVLLRSTAAFAKESAGVLAYMAQLFTSGFTKGTAPKEAAGWVVSLSLAGLALLFVAMLVTVFMPGGKVLLHLVAALTGVALVWYVWMLMTETKLEILCLPLLVAWLVYYLMCLFWYARQPVATVTGS